MSASTVALRLLDGAPDNPSPTSPIFKFSGTPRHARQLSGHSSPSIASECPPSLPFLDFVRSWNDSHIARWLAESKCGSHSSLFQDNDIRGDIILDLDQHALKEMGIVSVGDRIKILSAVKSLRQKCARTLSFTVNGLSTRVGSGTPLRLTESPVQAPTESSTLTRTLSLGSSTGRRLDGGRPPPLHLAQVSTRDLPQIVGNSANPPSARFLATPGRKGPQPSPGPPSSQIPTHAPNSALPVTPASHHRSPQSRLATPAQPNKPISRGQSTPNLTTPTTSLPGRRTPVQSEHPPPAFTNEPLPPAPASNSSWQGEYGLPRGPSPGNLQGGTFASDNRRNMRSPSPLQSGGQRPAIVTHRAPAHQKSGSTSSLSPVNGTLPFTSKPSAGTGTTPHPYASGALQPSSAIAVNLSPIAEMFTPKDNNLTPGYSVGRGPFSNSNRPTTPSHPVPMSLEILRRMCVKFILPDDGHTRMINVGDCEGGVEVLERALKKMNKTRGGAGPAETGETEDGGLIVDGWAVYLEGPGTEGTTKPLTEVELLSICHADVENPSREHGLTLRRVGVPPRNAQNSSKLMAFFGEPIPAPGQQTSPTSPTYLIGPKLNSTVDDDDSDTPMSQNPHFNPPFTTPSKSSKKTNRASTVSVMSGLGIPPGIADPSGHSRSPSSSSFLGAKKLRNIFGTRPPSELITSHLPEFFPFTEKKVLERTARHSMMRSVSKRDSVLTSGDRNSGRVSWNPQSRFSTSSMGSATVPRRSTSPSRTSMSSHPDDENAPTSQNDALSIPRMSISADNGESFDVPEEHSVKRNNPSEGAGHLLPPVQLSTESLSDSLSAGLSAQDGSLFKRSSTAPKRLSFMSELRSRRDRSDTASMLTLDEITAEVQSRFSHDGNPQDEGGGEDPSENGNDDEDEAEDSGAETIEEVDNGAESEKADQPVEDEEIAQAVTSTGDKRFIKWIKGALIGSGSFGNVYLGMDAYHGLLMAVKQVELPTGSSHNEERRKNMLSALEREIELLKELQHENIVQYLDSSVDDGHLNIFLEYVPGGSVATVLRTYGAFEEPLVRNWVKQILHGLSYLHSRDIIHRDIKGANILVDNKGGIKISDFGISKKVEDNLLARARVNRPSLQGSVFWMAPEVVKQTSYSPKADIWSLGCLVVEMLTGEHPWAMLTQMQAIFKIGSSAKPTIPPDITAEAEDFLNQTFELDYQARPSADDLLRHPWLAQDPVPTPSSPLQTRPPILATSAG